MGLVQEVRRLFQSQISSGSITYITLPALANGVALVNAGGAWAYGVWTQIVASVGAAAVWLAGVVIQTSATVDQYQLGIGIGAGAAEVEIANFPWARTQISAAGQYLVNHIWLPYPIAIAAATRVAGRCASATGAGADTLTVKIMCAVGV